MARLRIEFRGAQTVLPLGDGTTTIGRSNRCTVHLPDPHLAPIHFRIEQRTRGFRIKDDGSGLGTTVNGRPVYATTLGHGDVIEAGGVRCVFLERADAPAPPPAESRRRPAPAAPPAAPRRTRLYVGIALAACIGLAGIWYARKPSADEEATVVWQKAYVHLDEAKARPALARKELAAAAELLEQMVARYPDARLTGTARGVLADARRTLAAFRAVDRERERLAAVDSDGAYQDAFTRLARIREASHAGVAAEVARLEQELEQRRVERFEAAFRAQEEAVAALVADRRFAEALRAWRDYPTTDFVYRRRAEESLAALEKTIGSEYRGLLRRAGTSAGLDARIALLEAHRAVYRGTRHSDDLEVRVSAMRARRRHQQPVTLDGGKPPPSKGTRPAGETAETPAEAAPYRDPPSVVEFLKARRYGPAAAALHGITRAPEAKVRAEELTLLAGLFADLVAAVQERPAEFDGVLLPDRAGRADAVGADADAIVVRRDAGPERFGWAQLPAKAFPRLFRQAGLTKPARLGVALFYDEESLDDEAAAAYVAFFKSEQSPETLTRVLARRRGVEPPKAGFELFRGALVTPAERAAIELAERIEKLGRDAVASSARRRTAAWDELEKLGEPARATLAKALDQRRREAADELARSKAFTPGRFVAKFGAELKRRRQAALAFVLDAVQYPYPNKSESAQKEAERLVDAVRELFEKPYATLLQTSDAAMALDREIEALDARLARVEPLSEPFYESAVEAVVAHLDVRNIALDGGDRKRIDFNHAVRKYNKELPGTTVDAEERANVTAVNDYRWMMGLRSVKIDERLVRAARKHSIEMQQLGYFEHDSPTAQLRTPTQRARREGYPGGVAENIARGASTGVQAFWQWFRSSGHHRNMLRGHTEMGCGAAKHHWWTQKFGKATGRSLSPPKVPPDPDPPGTSGNGRPAPQ